MKIFRWGIVAIVSILGCSTTVPGIDSTSDTKGEVGTTSDVDARVHAVVADSFAEMADVSGVEVDGQDVLDDADSPDLSLPDSDSSSQIVGPWKMATSATVFYSAIWQSFHIRVRSIPTPSSCARVLQVSMPSASSQYVSRQRASAA